MCSTSLCFFFSSRRRHTRYWRDWSSDVCSSDLADIIREASATGRVLVVDETRRSGGVGEGVLALLVDAGYVGVARRVAAIDSFIPLGPAAAHVLVSEDQILQAARSLLA